MERAGGVAGTGGGRLTLKPNMRGVPSSALRYTPGRGEGMTYFVDIRNYEITLIIVHLPLRGALNKRGGVGGIPFYYLLFILAPPGGERTKERTNEKTRHSTKYRMSQ